MCTNGYSFAVEVYHREKKGQHKFVFVWDVCEQEVRQVRFQRTRQRSKVRFGVYA